jgi:hypothetical protein
MIFIRKPWIYQISLQLRSFIEKIVFTSTIVIFQNLLLFFLMIYKSSDKKSYNYDK